MKDNYKLGIKNYELSEQKTMKKKPLRSGYTTGACAAAAAKAAAHLALGGNTIRTVEIPFPDGSRVRFRIHKSKVASQNNSASASVIKDAGDDPDVTNGAEIAAEVRGLSLFTGEAKPSGRMGTVPGHIKWEDRLIIRGGKGVGVVTKPGLAVPIGEAAINPVPRKMITEAVREAIAGTGELVNRLIGESKKQSLSLPIAPLTHSPIHHSLEIIISVPDGEKLAKKTLNYRLGIVGGISILGTTGIVRPISSEAWTATITGSMDVAKATGRHEIVLSAGRASEKAHMKKYSLPEESYVMMGDYLEFSLLEAKKHGFKRVNICAQWAKMLKIAMATPQTHVRHGAIDIKKTIEFLKDIGIKLSAAREFNTAREIFDFINSELATHNSKLLLKICSAAQKYAEKIAGLPVSVHLVSYEGEIIAGNV